MFQPSALYLRRSWTIAWKNEMANSSLRQARGLVDSSIRSCAIERYVIRILALRPVGGSSVIFTPFCRIATGKIGEGMEVSHRRKSFDIFSGLKSSTILSNVGIQDWDKWQFWRSTQRPRCIPSSIIASAIGPWPWPSEMELIFLSIFLDSAKRVRSAIGSAPVDSTKISGVMLVASLKHASRSNGGGSMNFCPNFSVM